MFENYRKLKFMHHIEHFSFFPNSDAMCTKKLFLVTIFLILN